jgi:NAD(P)-dependent dehydrogenase (short-subunit alcohol dehydrogenase family)
VNALLPSTSTGKLPSDGRLAYFAERWRGALIHVTSVEALRWLRYQSAYAASKHVGQRDARTDSPGAEA